jgi:putative addiction module component (TIGR02574 family)
MNATTLDDSITKLSQGEKLALIGRLWATIEPDELPVSPAVVAELDRRWAEHLRNPSAALTLDELMSRVEAKRR